MSRGLPAPAPFWAAGRTPLGQPSTGTPLNRCISPATVPAVAEAAGVERLGDEAYVAGRRVARHLAVNELSRYEWAAVGMAGDRVERDAQVSVGVGGRPRRYHRREKALLRNRVEARVALHE